MILARIKLPGTFDVVKYLAESNERYHAFNEITDAYPGTTVIDMINVPDGTNKFECPDCGRVYMQGLFVCRDESCPGVK